VKREKNLETRRGNAKVRRWQVPPRAVAGWARQAQRVQVTAALQTTAALQLKQLGAVLMQEPFTKVQSTWVTAPPSTWRITPSSRLLRVSRLRVSFFDDFLIDSSISS
jgi:hypothetical protein